MKGIEKVPVPVPVIFTHELFKLVSNTKSELYLVWFKKKKNGKKQREDLKKKKKKDFPNLLNKINKVLQLNLG